GLPGGQVDQRRRPAGRIRHRARHPRVPGRRPEGRQDRVPDGRPDAQQDLRHRPARRSHERGVVQLSARLLALALLVFGVARAEAASSQLALARAHYAHSQWQKVIDTLEPVLSPQALINDAEELKEAHYLLGSAYFFAKKKDKAKQEFQALLFLDPSREFDPANDDPNVLDFFNTLKASLKEQADRIKRERDREAALRQQVPKEVV